MDSKKLIYKSAFKTRLVWFFFFGAGTMVNLRRDVNLEISQSQGKKVGTLRWKFLSWHKKILIAPCFQDLHMVNMANSDAHFSF